MCHDNGCCEECKETFKQKLQLEMKACKEKPNDRIYLPNHKGKESRLALFLDVAGQGKEMLSLI